MAVCPKKEIVSKEFFQALEDFEAQTKISKEQFIEYLSAGISAAYKKECGEAKNIIIHLNPEKCSIRVRAYKNIVATEEEVDFDNVMTIITNDEFDMTGFEFGTITSNYQTIMGEGTTVVRVELLRLRYEVDFVVENDKSARTLNTDTFELYETEIVLRVEVRKGYTFDNVKFIDKDTEEEFVVENTQNSATDASGIVTYTITFNVPARNTKVVVLTTKNQNTKFTVVYRAEGLRLDGSYTDIETRVLTGETEHILTREDINFDSHVRDGYSADHASIDEQEVAIAGDGSTVVYIYLNRDRHIVYLHIDDESTY